jgi:hypothetical protein
MYELTSMPLDDDELADFSQRKARAMVPMLAALAPSLSQLHGWPVELLDVIIMGPSHEASRRWLLGAPFDLAALSPALTQVARQTVRALRELPGRPDASERASVSVDDDATTRAHPGATAAKPMTPGPRRQR